MAIKHGTSFSTLHIRSRSLCIILREEEEYITPCEDIRNLNSLHRWRQASFVRHCFDIWCKQRSKAIVWRTFMYPNNSAMWLLNKTIVNKCAFVTINSSISSISSISSSSSSSSNSSSSSSSPSSVRVC